MDSRFSGASLNTTKEENGGKRKNLQLIYNLSSLRILTRLTLVYTVVRASTGNTKYSGKIRTSLISGKYCVSGYCWLECRNTQKGSHARLRSGGATTVFVAPAYIYIHALTFLWRNWLSFQTGHLPCCFHCLQEYEQLSFHQCFAIRN